MALTDDLGPPRGDEGHDVLRDAEVDAEVGPLLEIIVKAARDRVPGMEHVGVFRLDRFGGVRTLAVTSDFARDLDALQHRVGEGPALDLREARLVAVPQIRHDPRWPAYAAAASAAGLQAQLTIRVAVDDHDTDHDTDKDTDQDTVAGLSLYSTGTADIHPDAGAVAELFAGHAAVALGHDRGRSGLTEALSSREVVGQATGIIADRYGMTQERAFAFLVRAASQSNMPLREIAHELVDRRTDVPSPPSDVAGRRRR
jgi:hypothetical protein